MLAMGAAAPNGTNLRYWVFALILVALGFLTIFSIGIYFWFIAIALIVASPFRFAAADLSFRNRVVPGFHTGLRLDRSVGLLTDVHF